MLKMLFIDLDTIIKAVYSFPATILNKGVYIYVTCSAYKDETYEKQEE